MGATTYTIKAKGANVKEVFNSLVDDAVYEYGHDSYNGSISTTSLSKEIKLPQEILKGKNKYKKIYEYFDKNEDKLFPSKWETTYAVLGVNHYEAFAPEWVENEDIPERENGVKTIAKFSIMLEEEAYMKTRAYQAHNKYETLGEAKREAKAMALKFGQNVTIKKHRSNGEMFQLGHMNLISDGKEYKSARTAKTKIYKPIYEFMFFVYASC